MAIFPNFWKNSWHSRYWKKLRAAITINLLKEIQNVCLWNTIFKVYRKDGNSWEADVNSFKNQSLENFVKRIIIQIFAEVFIQIFMDEWCCSCTYGKIQKTNCLTNLIHQKPESISLQAAKPPIIISQNLYYWWVIYRHHHKTVFSIKSTDRSS